VDDEDLIFFVAGGLNPSYHPFITTLSFATRDSSVSFDDFQTKLLNYEQLLDAQQKFVQPDGSQFAFFAQKAKISEIPRETKASTVWKAAFSTISALISITSSHDPIPYFISRVQVSCSSTIW
jgi:hypothetical protein